MWWREQGATNRSRDRRRERHRPRVLSGAKKGWKVVALDIDADGAKMVAGGIDGVSAALDVGDETAVSFAALCKMIEAGLGIGVLP